jgi:chemotaxis protein CheD
VASHWYSATAPNTSLPHTSSPITSMPTIEVLTGEVKIAKSPIRIRASGLGSCVAVVLYDNSKRIGGIAHVMLPSTDHYLLGDDLLKYADEAVPFLIKEMVDMGANRHRLHARLVGGAKVVEDVIDIWDQVSTSCQDILAKHGIEILAKRIGGHENRHVILDTATGVLWYGEGGGIERVL